MNHARRSPIDSPGLHAAVAGACLAATLACGSGAEPEPVFDPPNVLLISLDTLRADRLGTYGYERETTPNIDALADRGVVFLESRSHAPNTSTSHASILTSLYPSVHGVWKHGQRLDPGAPVLAEVLAEHGYRTAAFTQLNGPTYDRGFDVYERLPGGAVEGVTSLDPPFAWLGERAAAGDRFFLFLHTYDVHLPYEPPEGYLARFADPDYRGAIPPYVGRDLIDDVNSGAVETDEADLDHLRAMYDAQLARADETVGAVLDELRRLGVYDDTLVVLLSDHGEELGDRGQMARHSHNLHEELLRTPLVIAGPGVRQGLRIETRVRNIDVAPTILEAVGAPVPELFMGHPLQTVWEGREKRDRDVLAERSGGHDRALISGSHKYFVDGRLFDLAADPGERDDVSASQPEKLTELRQRLSELDRLITRRQQQVRRIEGEELTDEEIERLEALGYL